MRTAIFIGLCMVAFSIKTPDTVTIIGAILLMMIFVVWDLVYEE